MSFWDPGLRRDAQIAVALGERPADLAILGGRLVDVHTGEIRAADVAIAGSRIAAVGDVERCLGDATTVVEAADQYLVPGLIDTHFHIGASGLAMTELARLLVPRGTAAIVTDFYEPGIMRGLAAMRFLLDETARTPLTVYFSPFAPAYGEVDALVTPEEFEAAMTWPETREVREWYLDREHGGSVPERRIGERARALGLRLSGHLAGTTDVTRQACVAAGIASDHEVDNADEALALARLGVAVQIRWSSGSRDAMARILRAIVERRCDPRQFMFSTDEADADDLADLGHIDHRVREAVAAGVPPVDAIRTASLNAATFLGATADLGSVAPGRHAFVNLVDDLANFAIQTVVAGHEVVAHDHRFTGPKPAPVEYPPDFHGTVQVGRTLTAADFRIAAPNGRPTVTARAIAAPHWEERRVQLPAAHGTVGADPDRDVAKLAVVERHTASGRIGLGFLQGFGLRRGAFGSSFHPVAMDLGIVGADDADMALVANRIAELDGGYVAALDGEVIAEVALPLLGYLSAAPAEEVADGFRAVRSAIADRLGCAIPGLYTTLGYLLLPVSPGLHLVADGLVRVEYGERTVRTPLPVVVE